MAAVLAAGFYVAVVLAGIAAARPEDRGYLDQRDFHLPAILKFAAELPRPDLRDYASATTPGYHLLLAGVVRLAGPDERPLRVLGAAFGAVLVGVLAYACARRLGPALGLAVSAPLACSMHVVYSGVWLLPDNSGWLGVLGMLLLALAWPAGAGPAGLWLLAAGSLSSLLVIFRQVHIWTAGLTWLGAWLGSDASAPAVLSRSRVVRSLRAFLATLPAFLILAAFVRLWGGLTPPRFQDQHQGFNIAWPVFVLAVLGVLGSFYAGWLAPGLARQWRQRGRARVALGAAPALGLLLSLLIETSYSLEEGRRSGLWNLGLSFPVVAGRSVLISACCALGGVVLVALGGILGRRDHLVLLAALAGFTLAQLPNHEVWQRYVEPMCLILLALAASRSTLPPPSGPHPAHAALRHARWLGPLALGLLFLAYTWTRMT